MFFGGYKSEFARQSNRFTIHAICPQGIDSTSFFCAADTYFQNVLSILNVFKVNHPWHLIFPKESVVSMRKTTRVYIHFFFLSFPLAIPL